MNLLIDLGFTNERIYKTTLIMSVMRCITFLFLILLFACRANGQTTYYISSSQGSDNNQGTISQPFQTLDKISSVSLAPGDEVLFKKGDRFLGHFIVNGSGSESQPIIISSYGEGSQPVISGQVGEAAGGDYEEAIFVHNHDNLVFENLCIENERLSYRTGTEKDVSHGIYVLNDIAGTRMNYTFRNLTVRNVYTLITVDPADQQTFNGFNPAGITLETTWNSAGKIGNIQGVIIETCVFINLQRLGVNISGGMHAAGVGTDKTNRTVDVIVRNNEFQHTGGTCVLPTFNYNCLIENNMFYHPGSTLDPRMVGRGSSVWPWHCINTVIQKNQCLHIRGILDSHGIHIDHKNYNTFVQYNYMEDCEGGFVEILGGNNNAVYRYNISINDGWRANPGWKNSNHTLWINNKVGSSVDYCTNSYIYNNTVYIDGNFSTAIDMQAEDTYVFNNIFYAENGTIGGKQVRLNDNGTSMLISNNLFYGNVNANFSKNDNNKQTGDPKFLAHGASSAIAYQLKSGSPAIDAGMVGAVPELPGAGQCVFKHVPALLTEDFFGNTLNTQYLNIGACNAKSGEVISEDQITITGLVSHASDYTFNSLESKQFHAGIIPANATNQKMIWTSMDPSIAVVADGLVTPLRNGSTKIIIETEEGKSKDTIAIQVKNDFTNSENIQARKLRIYPNPVNQGNFTIDFSYMVKEAKIELFDMEGKLCKSDFFRGMKDARMNASELDTGIYLVKIRYDDKIETHEVIIK